VPHRDTPLSGSNGARAPATNTSDDDLGDSNSVAGEVDRDDYLEIGPGSLHPDVFGGRPERRARGTKDRPLCGEQYRGGGLQQHRVETNASGERQGNRNKQARVLPVLQVGFMATEPIYSSIYLSLKGIRPQNTMTSLVTLCDISQQTPNTSYITVIISHSSI